MTGPPSRDDSDDAQAGRPKAGDVLASKYRVEKVIGEGGMGVVFAAEHLVLGQRVAVKVLHTKGVAGDVVVERFMREAQAVARLQGEHVARVMDAGSLENGFPFLAMEYLEGCDLEELVKLDGPMRVEEAADCLLQALVAIAEAHAHGIVHRDLKPSNLFLSVRPDGSNIVKILDFGISKQSSSNASTKELTGHAVLGTPTYMAPEQLRNASTVDSRADLWSLGVVLYILLTGVPPFDGDGVGEIFAAILETDAPRVRAKRPDVPEGLDAAVARCLLRKVDERWTDAAEFARALVPFGSGRWSHLADAAEQVLARARGPKDGTETPPPSRRLYSPSAATVTLSEAIRARVKEPDVIALPHGPTSEGGITGTNLAPQSSPARRRSYWPLVAVAALLVAIAIPLAASRHAASDHALAASASVSATPPTSITEPKPSAAISASASSPLPSASADLPAESTASPPASSNNGHSAPPRSRTSTPAPKNQRPSFLNSRK